MIYFVKKADFTNKKNWVNQGGQPQYSEIGFELWLDENNPIYKAEEMYRKVSIYTASSLYGFDHVLRPVTGERIF